MPSRPSPDQPRSEGSQVPKKGAWEEEVEGCTHLGEEPLDSQGCDHVAVKEGSGGWGEPPGAAAVPAVKAKEVVQSEPLFLWVGHFNMSPIYPEPHGLLLWLMVHLGLLGGHTAAPQAGKTCS